MKVYIGCFGSGLGHASRMLEIAGELTARGAELVFSSSGEVASLISSMGYTCNRLPLADVSYSESGAFQLGQTLLASPAILARGYHQLGSELANLWRWKPDVVLSDSTLPTVLAGKSLLIPTYTVLNQLNLASSNERMGPLSKAFSVSLSATMGRFWQLSDEVILPDLPPPYTISEKNLWGSKVGKTRYVGFLFSRGKGVPDQAVAEFASDRRPRVFWQVSGPPRTRPAFLRTALKCAEALSESYAFVISGGDPTGSTMPTRSARGWYYEWCAIADTYFSCCDVVVSRAGHGTIAQAVTSSKPSLLVPIPNQPEQEGNASKAEKLGVSIVIQQDELTLRSLKESVDRLQAEGYRQRASWLGDIARGFDARKTIVELLESAAIGYRRGRR
jgi:UDP-N-acetylglucosamine--N-acetylmuramyl-(pentapeptide) pyrophosphoryl-undecaprenol N-acetylglucosamine transferase